MEWDYLWAQVLREQSVSVHLRVAGTWLTTNTAFLIMAHAASRASSPA